MTNLREMLERLDLSRYYCAFVDEGFDSWETLMDITESDLEVLGVKLGHRRKLQRAILNSSKDRRPLPLHGQSGSNEDLGRDEDRRSRRQSSQQPQQQQQQQSQQQEASGQDGGAQPRAKRKYRRHPKPDEYAPERPPSAYVIFSNQIRDKLRGRELSFTEIAKLVGERWQELEATEKEPCEREAQALKEKYYSELRDYKKTPQYQQYQSYLADFKAKHSEPGQENKKPKLQQTNTANSSNVDSQFDAGAQQQANSPSESAQHSPSYSSPTVDSYRRFPIPPSQSEDGSASSYSAWRPGLPLTLFHRQTTNATTSSYPLTQSEDGSESPSTAQPAPSTHDAQSHSLSSQSTSTKTTSLPPLKQLESLASRKPSDRPLLNWPLHTTLPPIDPRGINRNKPPDIFASPKHRNPSRTPASLVPKDSMNSDKHSDHSLSTLLRATEHVERDNDNTSATSSGGTYK